MAGSWHPHQATRAEDVLAAAIGAGDTDVRAFWEQAEVADLAA
jgi:hypothetical protein